MYQLFPFLNNGTSPFRFLLILAGSVLACVIAAHIMAAILTYVIRKTHPDSISKTPRSAAKSRAPKSGRSERWYKPLTASKLILVIVLVLVGGGTAYASTNTFEVVTNRDLPLISVVRSVKLTKNTVYNKALVSAYNTKYNSGEFGIPSRIAFPETGKSIDIAAASRQHHSWMANRNLAQTFLAAAPRQKLFGRAIIYLRTNTLTTGHLGDVMQGDLISIETTQGWQLGYTVSQTSNDPASLDLSGSASEIVVIMIDDRTGAISSFDATLSSVGERI